MYVPLLQNEVICCSFYLTELIEILLLGGTASLDSSFQKGPQILYWVKIRTLNWLFQNIFVSVTLALGTASFIPCYLKSVQKVIFLASSDHLTPNWVFLMDLQTAWLLSCNTPVEACVMEDSL